MRPILIRYILHLGTDTQSYIPLAPRQYSNLGPWQPSPPSPLVTVSRNAFSSVPALPRTTPLACTGAHFSHGGYVNDYRREKF